MFQITLHHHSKEMMFPATVPVDRMIPVMATSWSLWTQARLGSVHHWGPVRITLFGIWPLASTRHCKSLLWGHSALTEVALWQTLLCPCWVTYGDLGLLSASPACWGKKPWTTVPGPLCISAVTGTIFSCLATQLAVQAWEGHLLLQLQMDPESCLSPCS